MLADNTPQWIPLLWPFLAMAALAGALAYGEAQAPRRCKQGGDGPRVFGNSGRAA